MEDVRSDLNALEQLINLLVRHLLAELGEDISQLSGTDITVPFLVENLETTDKLLYNEKKRRAGQQRIPMMGWRMMFAYPGCQRA